jgi:hypothetical protein
LTYIKPTDRTLTVPYSIFKVLFFNIKCGSMYSSRIFQRTSACVQSDIKLCLSQSSSASNRVYNGSDRLSSSPFGGLFSR